MAACNAANSHLALQGLCAMGSNHPSEIQRRTLSLLLADPPQNMIVQLQSVIEKTATSVLAMLCLVDPTMPHPQVICLLPTVELCQQTGYTLEQMARFITPNITYAYADESVLPTCVPHAYNEHVIISTPRTMLHCVLDWLLNEVVDLKKIKMLVLDGADFMIDQRVQQDQVIEILKHLSSSCQKVLLSAAYSRQVRQFAQTVIPNTTAIQSMASQRLANIKQFYVECPNEEEKFQALANLYGVVSIGQAMVFCHTRRSAQDLDCNMSHNGHAVALITDESTTEQRIAVLNKFRDGKKRVLISNNFCVRGVCMESVTLVVNWNTPMDAQNRVDCETYLHRISCMGHPYKAGLAISFVTDFMEMQEIQQHIRERIRKLPVDDLEKALTSEL